MPPTTKSKAAPPELYGVLGDENAYKQLRHRPDSEYLSRYPSFHPSSPAAPVGAFPTSADPSPAQVKHSLPSTTSDGAKSHRAKGRLYGENDMLTPAIQVSEVPSQPTGTSWYDPDAEVWKPKKSSSGRRQAPNRPTPAPPVDIATTHNDPSQPLTGILLKEPVEMFERTKGPRRSAMKGKPAHLETPSPLPPTAYLSPEGAAHRRLALRQGVPPLSGPSPPVTAPLNVPSPYWMSPATTAGRLSSAATSHRGSSAGTSSVAFTSTSYHSSVPSSVPSSRGARERPMSDGASIELPVPRQTLFVVNADPDSEPEPSPVLETKPFRPGMPAVPNQKPSSRNKKLHKSHESAGRQVPPPVPPLPPQFQAPPPPSYPPPEPHHSRTRSEPVVPVSKSGGDRERPVKRHPSDNTPARIHATSKPIPIPRSSGGHGSASHSDASSSSSEPAPFTPQATPPTSAEEQGLPAEWIYPLQLTLEELFKGGKYTFRITTRLLDGTPKISDVEIDVKPGWKSGTRIIFPAAGNERKPGVFQDMIFVVEQVHHERFARLDGGRLVLNQEIDLVDALKDNVKRPPRDVVGIDGQTLTFYPPIGVIKPNMETTIKGHGMWIRSKSKTVGRGDLIIKWNVCFPPHMSPGQLNQMRAIFAN